MIYHLADIEWASLIATCLTSVAGLAMLTLAIVAYVKVVVKGNGKPEKSELLQLIHLIKLQVHTKTSGNGQPSCPNTEAIQKIETVTLRGNTPQGMIRRNIKDSQRIKNTEKAGCLTAQATTFMAKSLHKQNNNGESGEWGKVIVPTVLDDD